MVGKDAITTRQWMRWNIPAFRSDPAVYNMTREQRWRYRDAIDDSWLSEEPGVASEDQWRAWMGFTMSEWPMIRDYFAPAFIQTTDRNGSELWCQRRLMEEHMLATSVSRARSAGGKARQHQLSTCSGPAVESREVERTERKKKQVNTVSSEPKEPSTPTRLSLPVVGGGFWTPTEQFLAAWRDAYPATSPEAELLRMKAWLIANPTRGKTARGISRFASAWLARSQDSGKQPASSTATGQAAIEQFLAEGDRNAS